jgi:hypothetical protein
MLIQSVQPSHSSSPPSSSLRRLLSRLVNQPINMISNIKHLSPLLSLQQKTLAEPPLLPLIPHPHRPTHNKHNTRRLPRNRRPRQHARVNRVTIKVVDLVLGGGEAGEKVDVGVSAEEGVAVP